MDILEHARKLEEEIKKFSDAVETYTSEISEIREDGIVTDAELKKWAEIDVAMSKANKNCEQALKELRSLRDKA